jgi:hypothetical protein
VGVCAEEFAANEFAANGGGENGSGSSKAHHVGISPQEDRGGTKGKMGEVPGAEEGGLAAWGACCGEDAAGSRILQVSARFWVP